MTHSPHSSNGSGTQCRWKRHWRVIYIAALSGAMGCSSKPSPQLPIGQGITQKEGMEQPVYYWDPVIAPCGMVVYSGKLFTTWQNDILVGGLVAQSLVHLHMQNDRVVTEERFYVGARVRDVTEAPDGALYIVTDEIDGRLLRVTPSDGA